MPPQKKKRKYTATLTTGSSGLEDGSLHRQVSRLVLDGAPGERASKDISKNIFRFRPLAHARQRKSGACRSSER